MTLWSKDKFIQFKLSFLKVAVAGGLETPNVV